MFTNFKKVHLIGIGGIGVSAIAKLMLSLGKEVSGSDLVSSEITSDLSKRGVGFFLGHSEKNLDSKTDLVIYSSAVPKNNHERKKAKKLKIRQLSYPEVLGEISKEKNTIAVSGTNGKSTTTAILGLILEKAGINPLIIVGSKVSNWNGNFRDGQGKYFVVEACEWQANMLNLHPKIIVLTNIEKDHLDYYKNLNHLLTTFQEYIEKLSKDDFLILNSDDPNLKKLKPKCKVLTYGVKNQADVMAKNIVFGPGWQKFDLFWKSKVYGLKLKIPGLFNIYNSLAALSCALALGIQPEIIKEVLENFSGIWRRFEVKNLKIKNYKLKIVSDYAHHPTSVRGTIQAAKEFYPGRRILVVFQPHHRNRTKKLFKDFVKSFDKANLVILSEIYDVAGRETEEDKDISSKDLVKAISKRGKVKKIFYAENLEETKKLILESVKANDVVLIMGAGDIYKIKNKI